MAVPPLLDTTKERIGHKPCAAALTEDDDSVTTQTLIHPVGEQGMSSSSERVVSTVVGEMHCKGCIDYLYNYWM